MTKFLAFGAAAGAGFQAWRQYPPDAGPLSPGALWLVFVIAVVCAYLGGRARRRPEAVAVAVASAEATAIARNQVQVVVMGGAGAGAGYEVPPWVEGAQVVGGDLAEGMDRTELLQEFAEHESAVEVDAP